MRTRYKCIIHLLTLLIALNQAPGSLAAFLQENGPLDRLHVKKLNCPSDSYEYLLSVLPGNGWDNLLNEERGLTTNRNVYSLCQTSADGKLLIPDDMIIEPIKSSEIKFHSEIFSHFTNYTSLTSFSMSHSAGGGFSGISINGDFSMEIESVRKSENTNNGQTLRSQLRHRFYIVHQLPDSQLHPRFRNRLLDIAAHLERSNLTDSNVDNNFFGNENAVPPRRIIPSTGKDENLGSKLPKEEDKVFKMVDAMRAAYLADLIVRDFGTHSLSSVEAGAILAKIDSLHSSSRSMNTDETHKMKVAAGMSFASLFNLKNQVGIEVSTEQMEKYRKMVASSIVLSHGGPTIRSGDTNISYWEENLERNLVAIDRRGRPLYDLITPRTLPELSETIALRVAGVVKAAVDRYYSANLIVGCLDPNSPYYDGDANVPADSCYVPSTNVDSDELSQLPFGGIFDLCFGPDDLCGQYVVNNLATGAASCPIGYIAVALLPPQVRGCANKCESQGIFSKPVCTRECAVTRTHWCAILPANSSDPSPRELGFLFGGLYTDTSENPMTNSQSCPMYYQTLMVGRRLRVCVSTDREYGKRFALKFGGFYACQSGNPLLNVLSGGESRKATLKSWNDINASGDKNTTDDVVPPLIWPKHCPSGYTSHLAAIEDTCQINYCIPANSLKAVKERRLKRPPFIILPEIADSGFEYDMPTTFHDSRGHLMKYDQGMWRESYRFIDDFNSWNPWFIAGIVMVVVALVSVIVTVSVWGFRKYQRHRSRSPIPALFHPS